MRLPGLRLVSFFFMVVSLLVTDSDSHRVRNAGHLCMDEAMKDHIQSNHGTDNCLHEYAV